MFAFLWRASVRAASATALVALLAGIPGGLVTYIGWPLPDHLPSLAELQAVATHGVTDQMVINTLAVVLWLVWLAIAVSVVVQAAAAIRGVQAPRLRMLGPAQHMAATLIAGLTFGVVAATTAGPLSAGLLAASPAAHAAGGEPAGASLVVPASAEGPIVLTAGASAQAVGKVTLVIDGCGYEHTVVKGESLWRIAQLCLGDPHRWPEIWELNKGKYWPHVSGYTKLANPDLIFPGWVLELPPGALVPPGADPLTPPPPVTQTPPPTPSPSQSAAPSAVPSPAATADPGDDGVYMPPTSAVSASPSPAASPSQTPSPARSASPSASASDGSGPVSDDDATTPAPPLAGVNLPGGWITAGLAAGLLAATAMVWRRRRQRYRPTPITSATLDEADLAPPLAAATRIRQALRRNTPDLLDTPPAVPTIREYQSAAIKPTLPPAGPSAAELAGAGTLPLSAGLGLTGPAAADAARAMLVSVLSSGDHDDPDAQGRAIIPATTLATLIAVSAVELGPIPRLSVAASMTEAITLLEQEIIRRSRILAEHEVADVATLRDTNAHAEPLPQLLLIADAPDPAWHKRLATAIRLGETVDIGTVLLGDWPHGTTLSVAPDGTTTGGHDGQRLAVLDTDTAVQALTMLHEAYGDQPDPPPAHDGPAASPRSLAGDLPGPQPAEAGNAGGDTHAPPPPSTPDSKGRAQVRVLGTPAVLDNTGQPVQKIRAKSIELLVYLAVNRSGAPISEIMEALWPDATWRRASERLSTCVANLRHAIRAVLADRAPETGDDSHPKIEPVINSGSHYRLDPAVVDVDWWTVLDAYAEVAAAGDDTTRLAHLKTAIGGPLADGADYEWAEVDREHIRRHHIKIYAQAADLAADDDPHQARVLLDAACQIDPLSEDLAVRAMRAAAALGDADAIRHRLRTLRAALDKHRLDLQPGTEQLAQTLLKDLARDHRTDT